MPKSINKENFNIVFEGLTERRKEVLLKFLDNETDAAIAKSLNIAKATVRKHIEEICKEFGLMNDFSDERRSKRQDLLRLFAEYKPELLKKRFPQFLEGSHSQAPQKPQQLEQYKTLSKNADFVGREGAIADLKTFVAQGAKVIGIYGKGGVGKTTLAQRYFETQGFQVLTLQIAMETEDITPVEKWIRRWLTQEFEVQPEKDFSIMLDQLREKLKTHRFGVLIDNLEPALDRNGKFIEAHRRYVELLKVLADPSVQSVTLITSRERLNESKVTVKHYPLPGLEEEAWREFFSRRDIDTHSPAFIEMHKAYGGNAKAMEIICGVIKADYQGDLGDYWQSYKNDLLLELELQDLVLSQLYRLEKLDYDAHKLLCRLGYYCHQDIFNITITGLLCLVVDVPEAQRRRIVKSLEHRYLIESEKGEYWLHPVIRSEARARLKTTEKLDDDLLLSMKHQIDELLASDENFQKFLTWVYQKSSSVQTPYKLAAVRAFYFTLIGTPAVDLNLTPALDSAFARDLDHPPSSLPVEDFTFCPALANAGAPDLALDFNLLVSHYNAVYSDNIYDDTFSIFFNLSDALEYADTHKCEWQQSLQQLIYQLPEPDYDEEEEFYAWWINESPAWCEELKALITKHRNIDLNWQLQFSVEQWQVLLEYYDANRLLVDCLNNASNVSPEVRSHIEDTLLLPIAEIEQHNRLR